MRVEANGHGVVIDDLLNSEERADEFLLMGLRLAEGIDPAALRGAVRPRARSAPHRGAARRRRHRRRRQRPPARHAGRISGARCRGRGSRGVILADIRAASVRRDDSIYAPKLFGDPATATPPPEATRITARPRSLVPSGRKRNRPSMPAKPDGLVSISDEKRCGALRARQCGDQRHRVIGERRGAHRLAAELGAVAAGEGAEARRIRRGIEAALQGRARNTRGLSHSPVPSSWMFFRLAPAAVSASAVATTESPSSAMNSASAEPSACATVRAGAGAVGAVFLERDDAAAAAGAPPA